MTHIIRIHPQAPEQPLPGAACTGCGVCCLVEPCPLGVVLSGRRQGACRALRWSDIHARYHCAAVVDSRAALTDALPGAMRWLAPVLAPLLRRLALRWIAAGIGCDSSLEATTIAAPTDNGTAKQVSPHD